MSNPLISYVHKVGSCRHSVNPWRLGFGPGGSDLGPGGPGVNLHRPGPRPELTFIERFFVSLEPHNAISAGICLAQVISELYSGLRCFAVSRGRPCASRKHPRPGITRLYVSGRFSKPPPLARHWSCKLYTPPGLPRGQSCAFSCLPVVSR